MPTTPVTAVGTLIEGKSLDLTSVFGSSEQLFTQTAATLFGALKYSSTKDGHKEGDVVSLGTSFRLQDVVFTHGGSEYADSALKLSAANGTAYTAGFRFERENDAPIVKSGDRLVIQQGKYYKLDSRLLKISDSDSSADSINISLAFPENGGYLVYVNGEFRGSQQFSYREMMDNKVALYVQDLSKAGNINVQVDDGHDFGRGAIRVFHSEFATAKNILPTIAAGTKQPIKFIKGGSTLITLSDEAAIGSNWFKSNDNGALAVDLKVKVLINAVKSGYFTVDGKKTMDFTYQEIKDGLVQFIHDGTAKKPSFQFKLVDAMGATSNLFSSVSAIGEQKFSTYVDKGVTKDNHAPEFSGSSYFTIQPATRTDDNLHTLDISESLFVTDPDGHAVTLSVFRNSLVGGSVSIQGGHIYYDAAVQNFVGGDVIKILADDGYGGRTLQAINISYTGGVPKVTANDFTLIEGVNVTLTLAMLDAMDTGDLPSGRSDLLVTITDLSAGLEFRKDGVAFSGSFTLQDVDDGRISIFSSSLLSPAFKFKIEDGDQYSTNPVNANINVKSTLDGFVFTGDYLDVDAQAAVTVTNQMLNVDTLVDSAKIVYTWTGSIGGNFRINNVNVNSFTQSEVNAGKVSYKANKSDVRYLNFVITNEVSGVAEKVQVGRYDRDELQPPKSADDYFGYEVTPWSSDVITYYFMKNGENPPYPADQVDAVTSFSANDKTLVRAYLQQVTNLTGQKFAETQDILDSHFTFGRADLSPGLAGFCNFASDRKADKGGDMWLDNNSPSMTDISPGSFGNFVFTHELGHGFGFSHPYWGANSTQPESDNGNGYSLYSNNQWTVMSYFSHPGYLADPNNLRSGTEYPVTYMPVDIKKFQEYYGVNNSYKTGNDFYYYDDISGNVMTIWDGGGSDTIDASKGLSDSVIDLRPGFFSSIGGTNNLGIAYDCDIENVIGGSGNDTIYGNGSANNLSGGKGDDTIYGNIGDVMDGGAGKDLFITDGVFGSVTGGDGTDTLRLGEGRLNLTGTNISGVEILDLADSKAQFVALNADQLFAFAQIDGDASDLIDSSAFRLVGTQGEYSIYQWLNNSGDTIRIDSDIVLV
jgi:Peptidase M10 serralysin C terminal/Cadherin-like